MTSHNIEEYCFVPTLLKIAIHLPTILKKFLIGNNNCITKARSPEHAAAATRCTHVMVESASRTDRDADTPLTESRPSVVCTPLIFSPLIARNVGVEKLVKAGRVRKNHLPAT